MLDVTYRLAQELGADALHIFMLVPVGCGMELDESGFPAPTGELEELDADSLVLALGQETDLSLIEGVPLVKPPE